MNYLSTDHLIVYAFLLITLAIGLWAGRGIKDIREYAIANKTFSTGALVLTYLATTIGGGSIFGDPKEIFTNGIIMTVALSGISISFLLRTFLIAPRMHYFNDCLTIGDVMGKLYGVNSKIITGFLSALCSIAYTGIQLVALGKVCQLLCISPHWGIIVGGSVLAIYSAIGGIKAVTITDVLQFIVLIVVIPVVATLLVEQVGGISNLLSKVPPEKFDILGAENFSYYLTFFLMWAVFFTEITDPAAMQRILMAKDGQQLRQLYFVSAATDFSFRLVIMLIGLAGLVLYPNIEASTLIPHIIGEFLPVSLKGLVIASILAMVMSTADSCLHAAGLTLTHDVAKPICDKIQVDINELRWARFSTLIIGTGAILIGLHANNLLYLTLIALECTGPILALPLLSGILGLKPTKSAFYVALGATLLVFFVSHMLLPAENSHLNVLISTLTNGIVFLSTHVIANSGFLVVNRSTDGIRRENLWQPKSETLSAQLQQWIPTPRKIISYSQQRVATYSAPYILFGVFCCINFTLPYFMWAQSLTQAPHLMLYLRLIGATLCALLIVQEKWPSFLLPFFPTFWHLTLLYCIPFTSTVMFLLTQGSTEWLINVAITIMFLIVLVDWMSFVILTALGIGLGFLFYTQLIGSINIQLDFSSGYLLVYQGLFATLIGLLFARRKQQRFDALATHNQALTLVGEENKEKRLEAVRERVRIIQTLKHARIQDLLQVAKLIKDLRLKAKKVPDLLEVTTQLEGTLIPMTLQLRGIEDRATNFLRLSVEQLTIQALLEAVKGQLVAQGKDQGIQFYTQTKHQELSCDPKRIQELLVSSIKALQGASDEAPILVGIEDTILSYPLPSVLPDFLKNVKALRMTLTTRSTLPPLWEGYRVQLEGGELTTPETAQELMLLENKRIVKAHYGYTDAQADTLSYIIPLDIGEVRPKDLDKPYMELGVSPVRADDHYEGAQRQEEAFLEAVQAKSEADIETVKSVIELIKWYHGPVSRRSGEPFYLHPMAVAQIVLDYNTDEATILGALLHDTVEDTALLLQDVEAVFGKETAGIVDTVTHLESQKESFYKVKLSAEENLLMLIEANDKRALYVKVADRMHNMRTISAKPLKSQLKTAKETLEFFVPLCKERLALAEAAEELKARSLSVIAQEPTL
ncbi:MAG: HD domain-containing protein [Roseivirga sp.]